MQDGVSAFTFATLLLFWLSIGTLIWFWVYNRSTPGLLMLLLSCIFGGIGLALTLSSLGGASKFKLSIGYAFFFAGHLTSWLGIAAFWRRKTKKLIIFSIGMAIVIYLFEVLHILNGADVAERTAVAAGYYALSALGVLFILMHVKSINREVYHTAMHQSHVGTGVIMLIFLFHGAFNLYHFFSWEGLGLMNLLGLVAPPMPLSIALVEGLIFAPMLVLGTVIMVTERLQTELRIEQMLDPVTKGLNKRAFIAVSKAILARARRNADAVTLIMIEIANFKDIREKIGREDTDSLVTKLGHCIFGDRREQDIFCRLSNDELVLLLPGTPEEGAQMVQTRIVDSCSKKITSKNTDEIPAISIYCVTSRGDDLEIAGMIDGVSKQQKFNISN